MGIVMLQGHCAAPAAAVEVVVTDGRNRKIKLGEPDPSALCWLLDVLGESPADQLYFAIVAPLMYVRDIDGNPIGSPATKEELEALLDFLEEDGIRAVIQGLKDHFSHPTSLRYRA